MRREEGFEAGKRMGGEMGEYQKIGIRSSFWTLILDDAELKGENSPRRRMGKDELQRMKDEGDFGFMILDLRFENREWKMVMDHGVMDDNGG